jgi:hypothetical protein
MRRDRTDSYQDMDQSHYNALNRTRFSLARDDVSVLDNIIYENEGSFMRHNTLKFGMDMTLRKSLLDRTDRMHD